jgi:hypothetical protein
MSTETQIQEVVIRSWDLFRLSKSKSIVDLVPNTLRDYNARGLPFYRQGKVVFVSKSELEAFIRQPVKLEPVGKTQPPEIQGKVAQ